MSKSSGNFIRLLILIISRSSSKLGHIRLKTRSLGQILEKPCVHSRVHFFFSNVMKLCQNVYSHNIWVKFGTRSCWVTNVMLGQISFVTGPKLATMSVYSINTSNTFSITSGPFNQLH